MKKVLEQIPGITENEALLIKLLVFNHDNTNYIFPAWEILESSHRAFLIPPYGRPELQPALINPLSGIPLGDQSELLYSDRFRNMLSILHEADARLGDARRTLKFAESRHIPLASMHNNVVEIGMPMWQYSGCASALLAAQRSLLDAQTPEGQEIAWNLFKDTRQIINETIQEEVAKIRERMPWVISLEDNVGELLREDDIRKLIFSKSPLERRRSSYPLVMLREAYPLESIEEVLECGIRDNANVLSVLIDTSKLRVDETVPEQKIRARFLIRDAIITDFAMDILSSIPGALRLSLNYGDFMQAESNSPFTFCPPRIHIPSVLFSQNMLDHPSYVVTQGAEWVVLAQEIGLHKIRVIFDKSLVR
jgi:hypothetical protein